MASTLDRSKTRPAVPVSVTGRRGVVTADLKDYALEKVASRLRRFGHRVRGAGVWLQEVRGTRPDAEKLCRLELELMPRGRASITAEGSNGYAAVAHAARRAESLLDRKSKRRSMARRGSRSGWRNSI